MLYDEIAKELVSMEQRDQEMRRRNVRDSDYWDERVDREHTNQLKEIVAKIGWPTISKVGREASHSAWLLAQHIDRNDLAFQKKCLELMKALPRGEIDVRNIAYLEDRVRVNNDQPQLYGTQFVDKGSSFVPKEIENPEKVDERRLAMGLGTLEDGIKQMYEKYRVQT